MNDYKAEFLRNIERLSQPGVLGFYNCCEVTEVFAIAQDNSLVNVFSIVVSEEHSPIPAQTEPDLITPELIRVNGSGYKGFGVCRYNINLERLHQITKEFIEHGYWKPNSKELMLGDILFTRPKFVPPEATESAPLNSVLKNNFWNGSHVLELFNQDKAHFRCFFDKPTLLQELSEKIHSIIPIKLASLSDRLGSIIFQFPVDVLRSKFGFNGETALTLELAWDKRVLNRAVAVTSTKKLDKAYSGFALQVIDSNTTNINTGDSTGLTNSYLWDTQHHLLLASSGGVAALRQIFLASHPLDSEPRQIVLSDSDAAGVEDIKSHRIRVMSGGLNSNSLIGEEAFDAVYKDQIGERQYSQEQADLLKKKDFVQYGRHTGRGHNEAINDLRGLIGTYSEYGAWLWDPFLNAVDIMKTLFFCTHGNAALRALGSSDSKTRKIHDINYSELEQWKNNQKTIFNTPGNNHHSLDLEFRIRHGETGWSFHDRFLIFPMKVTQEPRVYSLGTSVNSLGKDHHILQRTSNGRLVADAFQELWDQLQSDEFLVWKYPQ